MTGIPTYHVLALSGGGYRGLYAATVLAELETVQGRPISSHFDLICSTSAGGMPALGLAAWRERSLGEVPYLFLDLPASGLGIARRTRRRLDDRHGLSQPQPVTPKS
jgi:patatin-like phospholipase/acyl hydrolase